MKNFIFKYYGYIALVAFVTGLFLIIISTLNDSPKLIIPLFAASLSFVYFVQKQKLEELKLFKEIFNECNERYNLKNEKLNAIYNKSIESALTEEETDVLFDYFNLCGEEYLYYKKGYIYPEVWQAWKNGMEYFRKNLNIRELWDKELDTGSYYGLKF